MAFNLDGVNHNDKRVGYFPHTTGVNREGNACMMVVRHDPTASGCNPMYWDASPHNRYGHEFASQEEAEYQAKYARGSWSVKTVDTDNIKIGLVSIATSRTEVNMGDIA